MDLDCDVVDQAKVLFLALDFEKHQVKSESKSPKSPAGDLAEINDIK